MLEQVMSLMGLIASIWLVLGVFYAAKLYPNYNHSEQFCSELGAVGSPTQRFSPLINNYPLGVLFCLFGAYVFNLEPNIWLQLTGVCIVVHGLGTWVAGFFPMDADPYTKAPSRDCNIHSWAGLFMLLSLLLAPIFMLIAPLSAINSFAFKAFSIMSLIATIYTLILMKKAYVQKQKVGLYQRISYGTQLAWLSVFSLIISFS